MSFMWKISPETDMLLCLASLTQACPENRISLATLSLPIQWQLQYAFVLHYCCWCTVKILCLIDPGISLCCACEFVLRLFICPQCSQYWHTYQDVTREVSALFFKWVNSQPYILRQNAYCRVLNIFKIQFVQVRAVSKLLLVKAADQVGKQE